MKKQLLFSVLISFGLLAPVSSDARKKRVFKRKWSVSAVNGWSFYRTRKGAETPAEQWEGKLDGQMHWYFSALEISRNMGYYEIGARIQNIGPSFVTPFFTLNLNKNNSRASIIPSLTVGAAPIHIMGMWLRASLGLSLNRYISFAPFAGVYGWYKIKDDARFEKYNLLLNTGLKISLYY